MFVRGRGRLVLGSILSGLCLPVSIAVAAPAPEPSLPPSAGAAPSSDPLAAARGAAVPSNPALDAPAPRQAANVMYTIHPESRPIEISTLSSALTAGIVGGLVGGTLGGSQAQAIGTQAAEAQVHRDSRQAAREALVSDPALAIAERVAGTLAKHVGAEIREPAILITPHQKLKARLPDTNYIVDVETLSWSVVYFLTDMTHYGIYYIATYAIYYPGDAKPRLKGVCNFAPKKSEDSPSGKELAADNFAGLKRIVSASADRCETQIETQLARLT
jgi:hypothetical protein